MAVPRCQKGAFLISSARSRLACYAGNRVAAITFNLKIFIEVVVSR